MQAAPNPILATTNLVRRPVDGCVVTASGRLIPPPPWILPDDPCSSVAYDQWLLDQGRLEAAETNDEWLAKRLADIGAAPVDDATRSLLNDYLFGCADPEFEARTGPDQSSME